MRVSGVKRKRDALEVAEEERRARPHPYGVAPLGNMYMASQRNIRDGGLGELSVLTDTILGEVLAHLPAPDLAEAARASRALYAFSHADDLWKPLVLFALRDDGKFFFRSSWKQTFIDTKWRLLGKTDDAPLHTPIIIKNIYSDTLFQPHRDASMPILDKWVSVDNVRRVSAKNMSKQQFIDDFENPGVPCVITDLVTEWDAYKKWDWEYILQKWQGASFQCEAAKLTIEEFKTYCDRQYDDRPIYLFDSKFAETVPSIADQFKVPEYFNDDLFKVLGASRPDFRWLIMGPTRSGSSFHKDPNSTDAWNACIWGLKKWIFFPPSVVPPGVMCSEDGADVTSPISLVEWFANYYDRCDEVATRPLETLVRPGEMMYIPHGWWHLCLNLTPTLCITQNYASRVGLPRILSFLREQPHCISGVACERRETFAEEFRSALQEHVPEMLEEAEQALKKTATNSWATALEGADDEGFSFGF